MRTIVRQENANAFTGTLLEKPGTPTVDEMKEFFQANDYSAAVSGFDASHMTPEEEQFFVLVKKTFDEAWEKELARLGGKTGKNAGTNYPPKVLQNAESELITGIIMQIAENPELFEAYMNAGTDILMSKMEEAVTERVERGDAAIDVGEVYCSLADRLLSCMMNLFLKAQNVPEILGVVKKTPAHEDFNESAKDNRDKIDFERKWDHTRMKTGAMLSLDELTEKESAGYVVLPSTELELPDEDDDQTIVRLFSETLEEKDREIFLLKAKGRTQKEIADRLGYKSQGAVSNRLNKLEEKFRKFLRDRS